MHSADHLVEHGFEQKTTNGVRENEKSREAKKKTVYVNWVWCLFRTFQFNFWRWLYLRVTRSHCTRTQFMKAIFWYCESDDDDKRTGEKKTAKPFSKSNTQLNLLMQTFQFNENYSTHGCSHLFSECSARCTAYVVSMCNWNLIWQLFTHGVEKRCELQKGQIEWKWNVFFFTSFCFVLLLQFRMSTSFEHVNKKQQHPDYFFSIEFWLTFCEQKLSNSLRSIIFQQKK